MTKKIPTPLPSGNPESVQIRPFWKAYTDIFETSLSAYEKIILTAVASWPDGQCHYSEKTLARYASCSTKTIQRSIRKLADQGLLFVTPISGTTNIYRTIPWTQSPTPLDTESIPPWTESLDTLDTESTYKNIYKINNKIRDKSTVADAPTPTDEFSLTLGEPQDSEAPLESESVKEPIEISEAPPLPAAPPKAKKAKQSENGWSDVQAVATPEQWESIQMWRTHRTQMKKPCTPLSIMQNLKKYGSDLSAAIEHSIEKGWQGIFSPSRNGADTKEPLTAGLTDKEIDLRLDFIWAHYKDSPIIPVRPFKDLAEENFVIDVLRSIFGDDYEEAIKKRRTDEKSFYQSAFRNKYKQGVENTKV